MIQLGRFITWNSHRYGNVVYEVIENNLPCTCGENDKHTVEIVANNNFGQDYNGEIQNYNDRVGLKQSYCYKDIKKDLKQNNDYRLVETQFEERLKQNIINES